MIIYGSETLLHRLVIILKLIYCPDHKREKKGTEGTDFENKSLPINLCARYIETSFTLFQFALDIMGSVWVLSKYGDWDDAGQPNCNGLPDDNDKCCHKGMFLFAFIFIIVGWSIFIGFLVLCCISFMCCLLVAYICRGYHRIKQQQATKEASWQV